MPKIAIVAFTMFALGAEPLSFGGDVELTKYAVTQGGLLVVVLLLLYWQRTDNKAKHHENSEKITLLTEIAERSAVAAEKAAQAGVSNALALDRLSRAVENFDRRH